MGCEGNRLAKKSRRVGIRVMAGQAADQITATEEDNQI